MTPVAAQPMDPEASMTAGLPAQVMAQAQAAIQRPTIRNLRPQAGAIYVSDSGEDSNVDLEDEGFDEDVPTPAESAALAAPLR